MRSRTAGMWWGTAIETPDPSGLAKFYSDLLGWPIGHQEPGTAVLAAPEGSIFVDFQVGDLDSAVTEALALGAAMATVQPHENVRVLLDPAGHPFCLCRDDD